MHDKTGFFAKIFTLYFMELRIFMQLEHEKLYSSKTSQCGKCIWDPISKTFHFRFLCLKFLKDIKKRCIRKHDFLLKMSLYISWNYIFLYKRENYIIIRQKLCCGRSVFQTSLVSLYFRLLYEMFVENQIYLCRGRKHVILFWDKNKFSLLEIYK